MFYYTNYCFVAHIWLQFPFKYSVFIDSNTSRFVLIYFYLIKIILLYSEANIIKESTWSVVQLCQGQTKGGLHNGDVGYILVPEHFRFVTEVHKSE